MRKLLVIGGTGFLGFHIIKEAKKRKWNVTSISLNKPKKKRFLQNVKYKLAEPSVTVSVSPCVKVKTPVAEL